MFESSSAMAFNLHEIYCRDKGANKTPRFTGLRSTYRRNVSVAFPAAPAYINSTI